MRTDGRRLLDACAPFQSDRFQILLDRAALIDLGAKSPL
jgi:hypothetical protein